jgi:hypothetical protein
MGIPLKSGYEFTPPGCLRMLVLLVFAAGGIPVFPRNAPASSVSTSGAAARLGSLLSEAKQALRGGKMRPLRAAAATRGNVYGGSRFDAR